MSRLQVFARSRRKRDKIPPIGAFEMERVKVCAVCHYTYLLTLIAANRTDVLQYVVQSTATEAALARYNCHALLYCIVRVEASCGVATPFLTFLPSFYYSSFHVLFFSLSSSVLSSFRAFILVSSFLCFWPRSEKVRKSDY